MRNHSWGRRLAASCLLATSLCFVCDCSSNLSLLGAGSDALGISDVTFEGVLLPGEQTLVAVSATVTATRNAIRSVIADLSQIGGPTIHLREDAATGRYAWAGLVTPDLAGLRQVFISATDAAGTTALSILSIRVGFGELEDMRTVPLGYGTDLAVEDTGRVYVPSQFGGVLTVSGAEVQLIYTDGSESNLPTDPGVAGLVVAQGNPCSYTVPKGKQGWYYILLAQNSPATVTSSYVETGEADYRPWNGWWWPWNPGYGATLYDAGGCLDKYDRVYGTNARAWAMANEVGGQWWWGHCWGWSIASILLTEPQATTRNGISFTQDEMKGLYTALADNTPYTDPDLTVDYIPPGPPTSGLGEDIDGYCDELYRILRICVRDNRVPLQTDMRVDAAPPARGDEVWNHAIYKYQADFRESPDLGNERIVEIDVQVWANSDLTPPPIPLTGDRYEEYVIQLEFDDQGEPVADSPNQNWISASHYPPHDLTTVTGSPYTSHNPYLTKARIDGLYEH